MASSECLVNKGQGTRVFKWEEGAGIADVFSREFTLDLALPEEVQCPGQ